MYCSKCGTNVDDRASFCPVCGNQLGENTAPPEENGGEPAGGGYRAPITQRNIAVAIVLSFITCGIYMLYWIYCLVTDLNLASGEVDDTSGGTVVLLDIVTCSIYMLYWFYKAGGKVNQIHYLDDKPQDSSLGLLYLLLSLFGFSIVTIALIQNELNKVADM